MKSQYRASAASSRLPASEGSGLIDIRAMHALFERPAGDATRAAASDDERLPRFGGGGVHGLSTSPLVSLAPPAPPVAPASARSPSRLLERVAGVLAVGILGLGALLVLDSQRETEPKMIVAGGVTEPDHAEPEPKPAPNDESIAGGEPEPELAAAPEATPEPPKPRARRPTQTPSADPAKPPVASAPKPAATADPVDVDCLIDKNLPKCKGGSAGTTAPKPAAKPAVEPEPALAAKLDQSQILAGIGPVKTAAKSCGSGTTVEIKFSVRGSTGRVVSATPLAEHSNSAVGQCVTKAAKQATFAKFSAEQQGFSFKFRL